MFLDRDIEKVLVYLSTNIILDQKELSENYNKYATVKSFLSETL